MKNSAKLLLASSVLSTCFVFSGSATAGTVTIATVNNSDMIRMQRLSKTFEEQHPRHQAQLGRAGRERPASTPDH